MNYKALLICLFLGYGAMLIPVSAQEKITLQNPSFEDIPRRGSLNKPSIKGWHDCGLSKFVGETPPDIHPVPENAWEVTLDAYDGYTYLGMVTRENDSYESLSQALTSPIMGGTCYSFSAFLVRSDQYRSATFKTMSSGSDSLENFIRPAVFLIWGGNYFCDKAELLGESPPVSNDEWKKYQFLLQPQKTHNYITIEAFYKTPILQAYNGHVLVDNMSALVPVDCPLFPQDLIAEVSDPPMKNSKQVGGSDDVTIISKKQTGGGPSTIKKGTYSSGKKSFTPKLLTAFDPSNLFVGQKIRLDHLYFDPDSVNLNPESYEVLDELAEFLQAYPSTVIEVGGHSNTVPPEDYCMRISTDRAKSVRDYLISKGVPGARLKYKGYGKSEPLIAYDKYNKEARLKNQRVEIMILALS